MIEDEIFAGSSFQTLKTPPEAVYRPGLGCACGNAANSLLQLVIIIIIIISFSRKKSFKYKPSMRGNARWTVRKMVKSIVRLRSATRRHCDDNDD